MSDYDWCKEHKVAYLLPEMLYCPICWLEDLKKVGKDLEDDIFFDEDTVDEIIRLTKLGLKEGSKK